MPRTSGRSAFAFLVVVAACKQQSAAVDPSAPADCAKVAEILARLEGGPGAKPDAHAAAVAKHQDGCKSHNLNAAEATCLAKATDTWQAFECAPRMFPERATKTDCKAVASRMREAILADMPKEVGSAGVAMVDRMVPVIESSCTDDNWPTTYRECVAGAKPGDMTAFRACDGVLPEALRLKMGERLKPIIRADQPLPP